MNEAKQRYREIKEKRPIKVIVDGKRFEVPPMKMRYETFDHLAGQWGDKKNFVSGFSYDYEDGSAVFIGKDEEDILSYIKRNKDIITV